MKTKTFIVETGETPTDLVVFIVTGVSDASIDRRFNEQLVNHLHAHGKINIKTVSKK